MLFSAGLCMHNPELILHGISFFSIRSKLDGAGEKGKKILLGNWARSFWYQYSDSSLFFLIYYFDPKKNFSGNFLKNLKVVTIVMKRTVS